MEHTKTPWRIGNKTGMGSVVADEPVPEIRGSGDVEYYGGHLIAESIAPRNAEFIVRACNAHAKLVAALRKAEDALASCYNVNDWPGDGTSDQDAALADVRAALAAAGAQ
jgi:hypothetical protein